MLESIQKYLLLNEFWVPMDPSLTAETNWNNPDIRPNKFDKSIEGWLGRLTTWGEIEYFYYDKTGKKTRLDKIGFTNKLLCGNFNEIYSQFRIEIRHIYELDFIRTLADKDGKKYEEVLKIHVKLKPELKKGLSLWTKLFN
jgi:hypothetical protein